jgi:hypothetical protein
MLPVQVRAQSDLPAQLAAADAAIARSVLYAALFEYPLTLSQLRQTLIGSRQTPSQILAAIRDSPSLARIVACHEGFYFPAGRADLIETRRHREQRSRAFLSVHRPLLRLIAALPYVRMVALSGSIAHLNLENGGDLDLFIVTHGPRVWSTAVAVVLIGKLLHRRRTLCANYIVADGSLRFDQQDLFAANQVINLKPVIGDETFRQLLDANPFVREYYPNFYAPGAGHLRLRQSLLLRGLKAAAEQMLAWPWAVAERICRAGYRAYLRRRAGTWDSPEQVRLEDTVLKLHTRSHRRDILNRFESAVHETLD